MARIPDPCSTSEGNDRLSTRRTQNLALASHWDAPPAEGTSGGLPSAIVGVSSSVLSLDEGSFILSVGPRESRGNDTVIPADPDEGMIPDPPITPSGAAVPVSKIRSLAPACS